MFLKKQLTKLIIATNEMFAVIRNRVERRINCCYTDTHLSAAAADVDPSGIVTCFQKPVFEFYSLAFMDTPPDFSEGNVKHCVHDT